MSFHSAMAAALCKQAVRAQAYHLRRRTAADARRECLAYNSACKCVTVAPANNRLDGSSNAVLLILLPGAFLEGKDYTLLAQAIQASGQTLQDVVDPCAWQSQVPITS